MTIKSKYRKFISVALILAPMTLIMAFVGVMRNYGIKDGWIFKWINTWITMFPVAYLAGLLVIPFANKILNRFNFSDEKSSSQ
jgi:hypothetical protein